MAPRDTRQDAFRAGFENPLMGDIGPLQRLYGTVSAIGEELGGSDMGTPVGQRFMERQRATKADIKRMQTLREKHPEEFGRGQMQAQEQMDPYMLGLGLGSTGAMVPRGATTYTPAARGMPARALEGAGEMRALPMPVRELPAPQAAPVTPYYRTVPSEMGTSPGPMNAFNQNMFGMTTGRYGPMGAQYAPEMAVTDFESYAPGGMGRTSPETWGRPMSRFDENMLGAYRQGQFNRMGGRPSMGGEYTLEELGSAVTPYREGGLVYEPVGRQGQTAGRIGYAPGPIDGEFSEIYGIAGPPRAGYGGGMNFGVTREGMAVSPTGMRFDPRLAAAAIGGGAGYMAGRSVGEAPRRELPVMDVYAHRGPHMYGPEAPRSYGPEMSLMTLPNNPMQGQIGGAALRSETMPTTPMEARASKRKGGKKEEKAATQPQAQFEGNLNYYVTQALDRLFGQNEAERGREYQQYYEQNPY